MCQAQETAMLYKSAFYLQSEDCHFYLKCYFKLFINTIRVNLKCMNLVKFGIIFLQLDTQNETMYLEVLVFHLD